MEEKLREALNQRPVRETAQNVTYTEMVNVNESERFISLLAGLLLALIAILRHSWSSITFLLAGGYLIFRGLTGYCLCYHMFDLSSISQGEKHQLERGEQAKYQPPEMAKTGASE